MYFKLFLTSLTIIFALMSNRASAETLVAVKSTVEIINSYSEYGNGDIIFRLKEPQGTCIGYWLNPATPGFNINLSVLISAYHYNSPVIIKGDTDRNWSGSNSKYCHLYSIQLEPKP